MRLSISLFRHLSQQIVPIKMKLIIILLLILLTINFCNGSNLRNNTSFNNKNMSRNNRTSSEKTSVSIKRTFETEVETNSIDNNLKVLKTLNNKDINSLTTEAVSMPSKSPTLVPSTESILTQSPTPYNSEWIALRDIYNAMDGANWYYEAIPWDFSNHDNINSICSDDWDGIVCECTFYSDYDETECHIIELNLYSSKLTGTIPSSIGYLTYLTVLDLFDNRIFSSIPSTIGELKNLLTLYLDSNLLSGSIPSEIGRLSNLQFLICGTNQLFGSIPSEIGELINLQEIEVDNNVLSGCIPSEIGKLTKLTSLYSMWGNSFNCYLPETIGSLINLQYLTFNGNMVTGTIPKVIANLSNLIWIDLSGNMFSQSIPSELWKLRKTITYLDLQINWLEGSIPSELGMLNLLKFLDIGVNRLYGSIPPELGNLTSVQTLDLNNNYLTGEIPSQFGFLKSVTNLFLFNNRLTGLIPSSLSGMSSLQIIDISRNLLSGLIPSSIGNPSVIQRIMLSFSEFKRDTLSYLVMADNNFVGPIPTTYCQSSSLVFISMPVSNKTCYPVCLTSKLNENYLTQAIHCPGAEDFALCDLAKSTNIVSVINSLKSTVSQIIGTAHPVPSDYASIQTISVPNAVSYTISIYNVEYCQLSPRDQIRICPGSTSNLTHVSNCIKSWDSCDSSPFTVNSSVFQIIYASNNLLFGNEYGFKYYYGYELKIVAQTVITGWVCIPSPGLYLPNNLNVTNSTDYLDFADDQNIVWYALDYCNWVGITCIQGSIYQLNLPGYGISGTIPASISYLQNLNVLNLKYNSIQGVIPSTIKDLTNIYTLDLSNNNLEGNLPEQMDHWKALTIFNVGNNKLSGVVPSSISHMISLISFIISGNKFSGIIPHSIGGANMLKLQVVDVSFNSLIGTIPESLRSSPSLSYLNLANNELNGTIESFDSNLLAYLRLDSNKFSGKVIEALCQILSFPDGFFSAITNPHLTCYEPCWTSFIKTNKIFDKNLIFCAPSSQPSSKPSRKPFSQPSCKPSRKPSSQPYLNPTNQPSQSPTQPTSQPSNQPSNQPNGYPSLIPSMRKKIPSMIPSIIATSVSPTTITPTRPTHNPSMIPSFIPTFSPSAEIEKNGDSCTFPSGFQGSCNLGFYCSNLLCYTCPPGQYCPNGKKSYLCPPDLVAPISGLSFCVTPEPSISPTLLPSNPTLKPIQNDPTFSPSVATIALGDNSCLNQFGNVSRCTIGSFCLTGRCIICVTNQYCPDGINSYICPPDLVSSKGASFCSKPYSPISNSPITNHSSHVNYAVNIPNYEREALKSLYFSTMGKLWTVLNGEVNWDFTYPNCNPCIEGWLGISCALVNSSTTSYYHILRIDLSNRNIIGTISSSIANLTYLTHIKLNSNCFYGTLPIQINSLQSLQYIDISYNFFTGTIPLLSGWRSIIVITIVSNLFSKLETIYEHGSLINSFDKLSSLEYLNLCDNPIEGVLSNFSQLTQLQTLSICDTYIQGDIPSFNYLINLQTITLYNNHLDGNVPNFVNQVSLVSVDMHGNFIQGSLPSFDNLTKLEDINLNNNFLSGHLPSYSTLTNLKYLNVEKNSFTGELPILGNSNNVITIIIGSAAGDNKIIGTLPTAYCSYKKLQLLSMPLTNETCYPSCLYAYLNQKYNSEAIRCPGKEDIAICDFTKSTNVGAVIENQLTPKLFSYDYPHPVPYLYENNFPVYYLNARFYQIQLDTRCFLPENTPIRICTAVNCINLYCSNQSSLLTNPLRIGGDMFNISFSMHITGIFYGFELIVTAFISYSGWTCSDSPSISLVKDANNRLLQTKLHNTYANGVCSWFGISCNKGQIIGIDLNNFNIKGSISESLNLISTLQALSLNSNALKGSIPVSLSELRSLQLLDLSSNLLNGTIPKEIFLMKSLLKLSLAKNRFSGIINANVSSSLKIVILSNNLLVGQIPSSLVKQSVTTQFDFQGNSEISCFQPIDGVSSSYHSIFQLPPCVPTQFPTSSPVATGGPDNSLTIIIASSVAGAILIAVLIGYYFYKKRYDKKYLAMKEMRRKVEEMIQLLPLHSLLLSYCDDSFKFVKMEIEKSKSKLIHTIVSIEELISELKLLLLDHEGSINQNDYEGRTLVDIALEYYESKLNDEVLLITLRNCLPFKLSDDESVEEIDVERHSYAWIKVVSSPLVLTHVVETILDENPLLCNHLSKAIDLQGRSALDVAIPECRTIILSSLYFYKRYDILTTDQPRYQSQTCIIHVAVDHNSEVKRQVALKFMKYKLAYLNEIAIRSEANFSSLYVMDILQHHDSDDDVEFKNSLARKKMSNYPYVIVMPLADRNLNDIVTNGELIDQTDLHFIRTVVVEITRCLNHLHSKNFVHGDLKPKNIMRSDGSFVLIDLDGSSRMDAGYAGVKISSSYSPPELVYKKKDTEEYGLKQYVEQSKEEMEDNLELPKLEYDFLMADSSQDAWALGMTIFFLMSRSTFWQCDLEKENMCYSKDLENLYEFPEYLKNERLSSINDKLARNLVSNLLNKDPLRRPSMTQVLNHPFLTGKIPTRMIGERPEFDVFLSYRVASDSHHVKIFYDKLTNKGLKVWFDQKCLEFGKPWEEGFIDGLCQSRVFVPVLSREAFVNKNQNILTLTKTSPIDNVLLEYCLATELQSRNMIDLICPIMIGDYDIELKRYSNYFSSGSHPSLKIVAEVVVTSLEKRVMEVLDSQSLGMPLIDSPSVKDILDNITKNQGCFLEGDQDKTIDEAMEKIAEAVRRVSSICSGNEEEEGSANANYRQETKTKLTSINSEEEVAMLLELLRQYTTNGNISKLLKKAFGNRFSNISIDEDSSCSSQRKDFENNDNNNKRRSDSVDSDYFQECVDSDTEFFYDIRKVSLKLTENPLEQSKSIRGNKSSKKFTKPLFSSSQI